MGVSMEGFASPASSWLNTRIRDNYLSLLIENLLPVFVTLRLNMSLSAAATPERRERRKLPRTNQPAGYDAVT